MEIQQGHYTDREVSLAVLSRENATAPTLPIPLSGPDTRPDTLEMTAFELYRAREMRLKHRPIDGPPEALPTRHMHEVSTFAAPVDTDFLAFLERDDDPTVDRLAHVRAELATHQEPQSTSSFAAAADDDFLDFLMGEGDEEFVTKKPQLETEANKTKNLKRKAWEILSKGYQKAKDALGGVAAAVKAACCPPAQHAASSTSATAAPPVGGAASEHKAGAHEHCKTCKGDLEKDGSCPKCSKAEDL